MISNALGSIKKALVEIRTQVEKFKSDHTMASTAIGYILETLLPFPLNTLLGKMWEGIKTDDGSSEKITKILERLSESNEESFGAILEKLCQLDASKLTKDDLRTVATEIINSNKPVYDVLTTLSEKVNKKLDEEAFLAQAEANNVFYLGYFTADLPNSPEPVEDLLLIQRLCTDMGFQFSLEEQKVMMSETLDGFVSDKIAKIVYSKAQQIPQRLWCLFDFGNHTPWLLSQMENGYTTQRMTNWLESSYSNPFMKLHPHYWQGIEELLRIVKPYCELVPDNLREELRTNVGVVFKKLPPLQVQERSFRTLVPTSGWKWIQEPDGIFPGCIFGDYFLVARGPDSYEVILGDRSSRVQVTRNKTMWRCSAHPNANERNECPEMQAILEATDGGRPVTQAGLVLVRTPKIPKDSYV